MTLAAEAIDFHAQVRPLLASKCFSCHGPEKQEGGLRLDRLASAIEGGFSGAAVVPGSPEASLLVKAIGFNDPELQMPPKQKLSDLEIGILTEWILSGAPWPELAPEIAESSGPIGNAFTDARNPIRKIFGDERLDLWSLKKPTATVLPENSAVDEVHPIDAMVQRELHAAGISPAPMADRRTLIRRLTFDLTGLPPTPDEVAAFVADTSTDAYEKLVERLLASPRYGERQASLWLDVVRYADTNGYERDEYRPLVWQYRDYVIRSFNADKPFDQFIREQLAGDELLQGSAKTTAEADMLIATGYLRLGQWDSTASIFQEEPRLRAEQMADLTNTTAAALLGLTMSCCQCHDHKYDPLSQADHYRLRAFFAGVTARDDLAISLPDEQAEIEQHNAALDLQAAPLKQEQAQLDKSNEQRHAELQTQLAAIESQKRKPRIAMGATDAGSSPPATHVLYQGDYASPREEVLPGFPSVFTPVAAEISQPHGQTSGRRLALAHWIASPQNPWTARVLVNRIWQQHFGSGLVATPNDFGYSGAKPTHPELLDWLALQFVARGWSIKELHRLIVTTATYQQSSSLAQIDTAQIDTAVLQQAVAVDPSNQLLWRQNVRRLDAESLRDSMLAVSGLLRPDDAGKPRWPTVPEELRKAQPAILEAEGGADEGRMQGWYTDPVEQCDVRSVFLVRKRCLPVPFLQAFDLPDSTVSCARRDTTVVAPQALMLFNSPEAIRYAQALATRIAGSDTDLAFNDPARTEALVTKLFDVTLCRRPTPEELQLATELLARHAAEHHTGHDDTCMMALTDLCRAMLNLNEFAYID